MAIRSAALADEAGSVPGPDDQDPWLVEGFHLARAVIRRFRSIPAQEAEDLAQEIVIVYWLRTCAIANPAAWFAACARHRALRLLKQHARRRELLRREPPKSREIPF